MPYATSPGQPPVPYFELLRLDEASSADDRSACAMEVGRWLAGAGELGIHAAVTGFADCVLSYAATAPAGQGMNVTLGLQVDFWRGPPTVGDRLTGSAEVVARQGAVSLVHGRMTLGDDVLATASLRAMAAPAPSGSGRPGATGERPAPATRRAHVGRRVPAALRPVLDLELAGLSGAEILPAKMAGAAEGVVQLRVVPPPAFERTVGVVHGGAVAALGQLGAACARRSVLPDGGRPRLLGAAVDYLRPTPVGEPLLVRAEVVHRSRRVILVEVDLLTLDGRRTARVIERAVLDS